MKPTLELSALAVGNMFFAASLSFPAAAVDVTTITTTRGTFNGKNSLSGVVKVFTAKQLSLHGKASRQACGMKT